MSQLDNMLMLCGELDGIQPNESSAEYLRRLIDGLILSNEENERLKASLTEIRERAATMVPNGGAWAAGMACIALARYEQNVEETKP